MAIFFAMIGTNRLISDRSRIRPFIFSRDPFRRYTIVGQQTHHTRTQIIPLFEGVKEGQLPSQENWYPLTELNQKFSHLHEQ